MHSHASSPRQMSDHTDLVVHMKTKVVTVAQLKYLPENFYVAFDILYSLFVALLLYSTSCLMYFPAEIHFFVKNRCDDSSILFPRFLRMYNWLDFMYNCSVYIYALLVQAISVAILLMIDTEVIIRNFKKHFSAEIITSIRLKMFHFAPYPLWNQKHF